MDREKWKLMTTQSLERGRTAGNGISYNLPDMRTNETGGEKRKIPKKKKTGMSQDKQNQEEGKSSIFSECRGKKTPKKTTQYFLFAVFNER